MSMAAGTVRKTLPLEFGQLQRALTITSAGYADPQSPSNATSATDAGSATKLGVIVESNPDIMIQPIAPAGQSAATAVFHLNDVAAAPPSEAHTGVAFGQIYEA